MVFLFVLALLTDGTLQTQNDFLREFRDERPVYLQAMLEREDCRGDGVCSVCKEREGIVKCLDCFGQRMVCKTCILATHQHLPFHRMEVWNGQSFSKSSLFKLGFVFHVGHGGQRCPCAGDEDPWEDVDEDDGTEFCADDWVENPEEKIKKGPGNVLVFADTGGVFRHRVRWCNCTVPPDHAMQLFRDGLFPASLQQPSSAFTFAVLDHFYIDAMECKTAAQSFYRKLCRLTNNAFPNNVPVSDLLDLDAIAGLM